MNVPSSDRTQTCPSKSPDADRCVRPGRHSRHHRGTNGRKWLDGASGPARWLPFVPTQVTR